MIFVSENPTKQAAVRGFLGSCPNCGQGRLFRAYLKPVEVCRDCGEALGHVRADDGPAWLTVMVVGHIMVALLLTVRAAVLMPLWASLPLFGGITTALVLALLPRAKGAFIGLIWSMNSPGSERDAPKPELP